MANAKFADVDTTHPYFHAIDYLEEKEVVQGYKKDDNVFFRPLQPVNRAEALKILILSADIYLSEEEAQYFKDVQFEDWFSAYVNTAADLEIVKGFAESDNTEAETARQNNFKRMEKDFPKDMLLLRLCELNAPDDVAEALKYKAEIN